MFICENCGNKDLKFVGVDKFNKLYCRLCVAFKKEKVSKREIEFDEIIKEELDYSLSPKQEEISNEVRDNFINHRDCLIYAVCGAGKTELVYKTIAYCLNNHLQVGFTIPRKDVVIDLEPRIKKAFPNVEVVSLYQGHTSKTKGDIILLTTHQLYRYENYFDLLIIDETDAFPYKGNYLLHTFFKKALKGNYIMMSATPLEEMVEEINRRGGKIFSLMTRYHNHPLIVPQVKVSVFFQHAYLIKKLREFKRKNLPTLVFAPTIKEVEDIYDKISFYVKKGNYVHSKRVGRNQIVEDFKQGKYDYLVTSSILERGITLKNLQVIVFDASSNIFDDKALVQISGRVGRKIDAWDGEVIYICSKVTPSITKSIQMINDANRSLYAM